MDVTIAIVNYNSSKMLEECLKSFFSFAKDFEYEIIVVDNASSNGSLESIKQSFPSVRLIENIKNLGFSKAVNQVFQISTGDYFFLLNPDTILTANIFPGMIDFFNNHPEAGIVSPRVQFPNGQLHPSARRYITFIGAILDVFQIHFYFPNNAVAKRFNYNNWKHESMKEVDWVTGAAFMTKREIFKKCGMMDERYFMYFEDMDYCMSVKENGYKIFFCPQFSIIHYHAKGGSDKIPVRSVDYFISLKKYLSKHYGLLFALVFRASMCLWGLIYLSIKTFKYLIYRKGISLKDNIDVPLRLIFFKSHEN